jgi:hypothetical protein
MPAGSPAAFNSSSSSRSLMSVHRGVEGWVDRRSVMVESVGMN